MVDRYTDQMKSYSKVLCWVLRIVSFWHRTDIGVLGFGYWVQGWILFDTYLYIYIYSKYRL